MLIFEDIMENTTLNILPFCDNKGSIIGQDECLDNNGILFHIEHKWEGIVSSIDENTISSHMYDVENDDHDEFIFSIEQVPEDDINLVEKGALFYYYIGYISKNGTREKSDLIKFRRRVNHKSDIDDILDTMNKLDFDSIIKTY